MIGGTLVLLTSAESQKKKTRVAAAMIEFKKGIHPMLVRIYPRSIGGPLRQHYRIPGNQKRRAFADVLDRKLEIDLTTVQVTTNFLEMLKDRRDVSTSQVAAMGS